MKHGNDFKNAKNFSICAAIAHFNSIKYLTKCIKALYEQEYAMGVVVYDDNSSQNVENILSENFPDVILIKGDGNGWWAGGTNKAIKECLARKADYILLLNPDTVMQKNSISYLLKAIIKKKDTIVSSVVVKQDEEDKIWWAGTSLSHFPKWLPLIVMTRYLYKKGRISALPNKLYKTSEVHGRGVLIPASVFKKVGLYNDKIFPHYGADIDFSWRCLKNNVSLYVEPKAKVLLDYKNTGKQTEGNVFLRLRNYYRFLTKRKNGEFLRVSWNLLKMHVDAIQLIPTFLSWLLLNTVRFFQKR